LTPGERDGSNPAPLDVDFPVTEFRDLSDHLARTDTVTIVTSRADGSEVATPIWAVVVDGVPYVRSAYGEKATWNRRARAGRPVAFTLADGRNAERDARAALDDPRRAVTVVHIAADAPEQDAVDAAFRAKYGHTPHIGSLLSDDARARTLRVEPA
jgi:hypothetical protein